MIRLLKRQSARKKTAATDAEVDLRQNQNLVVPKLSPVGVMGSAADVRTSLTGRLVTLLPDLTQEKYTHLYTFTVKALGNLALDEVLKIRLALSSALRDHAYAPPKLAAELSRAVEQDISEPILRFCTQLPDTELVMIVHAQDVARLSRAQEKELAEVIDASVRDILMNVGNFDLRMTEEITAIFRRRLNLMKAKILPDLRDDEAFMDALALRKTSEVYEALARRLGMERKKLVRIFETRSAKSIVALCWRAGLSMRTALMMQRDLGLVSAAKLIYPKDGSDYPMSEVELRKHLDLLGMKT